MKYGIIDVGSNSVRLLISENGKSLIKTLITTRLAEGKKDGLLNKQSSLRTLKAISDLKAEAERNGADKIFIFATAAVRNSVNGAEFAREIEKECGVAVDVVSGETEARLGLLGALKGQDGAVLDIGGGSTEIAVTKNGECVYSVSVPMGAVVLTDKFGQDSAKISEYARCKVKEFGEVPVSELSCVGGTCTTLAAINLKLAFYDPEKVDGYRMTASEIARLKREICALSVEERKTLAGLQKERADIIHAGACIFEAVTEYLGVKSVTVSDSDNLEGYLRYITEKR